MHTGVFLVLLGEGLVLRSTPLLVLVAVVVALHLFYIPLCEERGLEEESLAQVSTNRRSFS
jgi:protein-S-isoprenylcysteine O-methyltransferase Ste14